MPRSYLCFALLSLSLALAACGAPNPNFCEGSSCDATDSPNTTCSSSGADPSCPPDNPICMNGLCTGMCTTDDQCSSRTDGATVCLVATGDCVQCDEPGTQASPGSAEDECTSAATAVCDATSHTCRACRANGECASGVCDVGSCVDPANVLYMATTGSDVGSCDSRAAACLTLDYTVSKTTLAHRYIVMAPSATAYLTKADNNLVDINNKTPYIVGTGATLHRSNTTGAIINIRNASNVVIDGLTIESATGSTDGTAITNSATVELRGVRLRDNARFGIESSGTLRMFRSEVTNNDTGGINITDGNFTIVNNMITLNGGISTQFGGVSIGTAMTGNTFAFNTLADNAAGAASPDTVNCGNVAHPIQNNILMGVMSRQHFNAGSACVFTSNVFGPDGALTGTGNMQVTDQAMLMFKSATNYHVNTGTAATGKADATTLTADTMKDIDGDAREMGGTMVEVGADEIP